MNVVRLAVHADVPRRDVGVVVDDRHRRRAAFRAPRRRAWQHGLRTLADLEAPVITVTCAKSSILRIVRNVRRIDLRATPRAASRRCRRRVSGSRARPVRRVLAVLPPVVRPLADDGEAFLEAAALKCMPCGVTRRVLRILQRKSSGVHSDRRASLSMWFRRKGALQIAVAAEGARVGIVRVRTTVVWYLQCGSDRATRTSASSRTASSRPTTYTRVVVQRIDRAEGERAVFLMPLLSVSTTAAAVGEAMNSSSRVNRSLTRPPGRPREKMQIGLERVDVELLPKPRRSAAG